MKRIKVTPRQLPGEAGYITTFFHPVEKKRITRSLKTRDKYQARVTCRALEEFANNPEKYSNFVARQKLDAVARAIFYNDNTRTIASFDDMYGDGPKSAIMKRVLKHFPKGETPDYFEPALTQGLARTALVLTNRGASRKELSDFEKTLNLLFFILEDNQEQIAAHQRARVALNVQLAEAYEWPEKKRAKLAEIAHQLGVDPAELEKAFDAPESRIAIEKALSSGDKKTRPK